MPSARTLTLRDLQLRQPRRDLACGLMDLAGGNSERIISVR